MTRWEGWLAEVAEARGEAGLNRVLRPRGADDDVLDLAGNECLGLSKHPVVRRAAAEAAQRRGAGSGASLLVNGTPTIHEEPAPGLATFTGHQAGPVLPTGFHDNLPNVPPRAHRTNRK